MRVIKRDTTTVDFDINRIFRAISKASNESTEGVTVKDVTDIVKDNIASLGIDDVPIETIQDTVEKSLMASGYHDTAKKYILYRHAKHVKRQMGLVDLKIPNEVDTPWGPLGYVTYKRTYARDNEEFRDTITRVLVACQTQLKCGFTNQELQDAYTYLISLKASVAGRFLWQLGTETVNRHGLASLQNCAFVTVDHPIRPFTWAFDMLMLGAGVGVSVQKTYVDQLPTLPDVKIQVSRNDTKDADFIIPDSRQGWVSLLEHVLEAYYYKSQSFSYSTILIRGAGSKISGFGGVASGPEELCNGITNICGILDKRRGQRLHPIDCMDIINIIGSIVVAGNVRRSAIIVLGDPDDTEYLRAKRWDLGSIPNWRCMSNNSVVCNNINDIPEEFWEGYMGNGEPYGLINLDLSRKVGRLVDGDKYSDPTVKGYNPCAEISLSNFETCCLAEVFLPNIASYDEFKKVSTMLYRICKHSLTLPCHHPETNNVVKTNFRIGIGITGYLQSTEEQKSWLSGVYEHLRAFDEEYSARIGVNKSVKLTTCKPSGTLSLLAGVTPGAHPAIYRYFIRRIRISASNPLVDLCRKNGYHCEPQLNFDGTHDTKTIVVSFPCCYPDNAKLAKDMSAVDQLETVKEVQNLWSDNSVSVTIYYKKEELPEIKEWLRKNYTNSVKTVSFLLHSEHGFKQAPYEEISEEQYRELVSKCTPITHGNIMTEDDYSGECASGACPIK